MIILDIDGSETQMSDDEMICEAIEMRGHIRRCDPKWSRINPVSSDWFREKSLRELENEIAYHKQRKAERQ